MIICYKCKKEYSEDTAVCDSCGAKLEKFITCRGCGRVFWFGKERCSECYAPLSPFCYAGHESDGVAVYADGSKKIIPYGKEEILPEEFLGDKELVSLMLPNSVKAIGENAFCNCSSLEEVYICDGATLIDAFAFCGCASLERLRLPETLKEIGDNAFCACKKLTEAVLPNGVEKIGCWAFSECEALEKIGLPESLTVIDRAVFEYCTSLREIDIPANVERIEFYAFMGCSSLEDINIGRSVNYICDGAFSHCGAIERISADVGNTSYYSEYDCLIESKSDTLVLGCKNSDVGMLMGVTAIGAHAFSGCKGLLRMDIPDTVTRIGDGAFSNCKGLTEVNIPDSVTVIEDGAFYGCRSLESLTVPESVTRIGVLAFDECEKLTVNYKGTPEKWKEICRSYFTRVEYK